MPRKAGIEDYLKMMLGPQPKQHIAKTAADMLFGGVAQPPPENAPLMDRAMHALAQPGVMPVGMTVYHGTPHKFAPTPKNPLGEFDLSKIGTGEGAQAYGHGVYLSESPAVANTYRGKVSAMHGTGEVMVEGRKIDWNNPMETAAFELARHGGDRAAAADFFERTFKKSDVPGILRSGVALPKVDMAGLTYKADLADEAIPNMLDWDAPLSQQPEAVRKAVAKTDAYQSLLEAHRVGRMKHPDDWTAGQLYYRMAEMGRGMPHASEHLARHGVPGIRYFDQGSRSAGAGTRNFVVFEPDILKIQGVE